VGGRERGGRERERRRRGGWDKRRGDTVVRGFFTSQTDCVTDTKAVDADAPSYVGRHRNVASLLAAEEKLKISKHRQDCLDNRADFVPIVVTCCGCVGEQGKKYLQRVARVLAGKWEKSYSEVVGFIMCRVSVAIARAVSMCIRSSRNPLKGARWCMQDGAALAVMLYE
jgi:hypothetical protein